MKSTGNNRERLVRLLAEVKENKNPSGWEHISSIAVGGLVCIGFSNKNKNEVLVSSSSGRGVIDCNTGNKLERDNEEYGGLDETGLYCQGIGSLAGENISMAGIYGGGLPLTNRQGDSLEIASPNWPEIDLILCQNHKTALVEGHQSSCSVIISEHLRAYGFSWCGNYIIAATGSEFDIWKKQL